MAFTIPTVRVLHSDGDIGVSRFIARMQVFMILMAILLLVAGGALLSFVPPEISEEVLTEEIESPPPTLDAAVIAEPPFSELREAGTRPVPVSSPRPFPFQP